MGERPLSLSRIDSPPLGQAKTKNDLACPGNYERGDGACKCVNDWESKVLYDSPMLIFI